MPKVLMYKDKKDEIFFLYHESPPGKKVLKGKINLAALCLYGIYRNTVYDSYKEKKDVAPDIKEHKNVYREEEGSKLSDDSLYQDPIYHYSVKASLGAMADWAKPDSKIKSYIAYSHKDGHPTKMGFVQFVEKRVSDKDIVYIAEAGVVNRGESIGRRLMECVLSSYPEGTEFHILTRVFNKEAKALYGEKLKFKPMESAAVSQLGYDDRYCGFAHVTTKEEITAITERQILHSDLQQFLHSSSGEKTTQAGVKRKHEEMGGEDVGVESAKSRKL